MDPSGVQTERGGAERDLLRPRIKCGAGFRHLPLAGGGGKEQALAGEGDGVVKDDDVDWIVGMPDNFGSKSGFDFLA